MYVAAICSSVHLRIKARLKYLRLVLTWLDWAKRAMLSSRIKRSRYSCGLIRPIKVGAKASMSSSASGDRT